MNKRLFLIFFSIVSTVIFAMISYAACTQVTSPTASGYCECNISVVGLTFDSSPNKYLCVQDIYSQTDIYVWKNAPPDYFKIFDTNAGVISNSADWYYCNASGNTVSACVFSCSNTCLPGETRGAPTGCNVVCSCTPPPSGNTIYTSTPTLPFTVPSDVHKIYISAAAGGGAGGTTPPGNGGGGGGGSGGYVQNYPMDVTPGTDIQIIVGVGGPSTSQSGQDTKIGTLILTGGIGGSQGFLTYETDDFGATNPVPKGGAGGAGGTPNGQSGGTSADRNGANGGSTPFGTGGYGSALSNCCGTPAPGGVGSGYGSGGGGSGSDEGQAVAPGGAGASGFVNISWGSGIVAATPGLPLAGTLKTVSIGAAITNVVWGTFLTNNYVWFDGVGFDQSGTAYYNVSFPLAGTYTFDMSVDNQGKTFLDLNPFPVVTAPLEAPSYTNTYTGTSAVTQGNHIISVYAEDNGINAYGFAAQIKNSSGTVIWSARTGQILTTPAQVQAVLDSQTSIAVGGTGGTPLAPITPANSVGNKQSFPNVIFTRTAAGTYVPPVEATEGEVNYCDPYETVCDPMTGETPPPAPGQLSNYDADINAENKSFICYENNNFNNFGECCYYGCYNPNGTNDIVKLKTFGNGANIKSLRTFDKINENGELKNGRMGLKFSSAARVFTINGNIPQDMRNLGSLRYLSFDINSSVNLSTDFSLKFYKDTSLLQTISFTNYMDYTTNLRWHHVKIPIPASLTNVSKIQLYYSGSSTAQIDITLDNIYLGTDTYYCSRYEEAWIDDLDPTNLYADKQYYSEACKSILSYGWTGNQCCGDDGRNEYFNDSLGGCFQGYPVMNDTTVKNSINIDKFRDLLWFNNGSSVNGSFYQCAFSATYTTICNVKNSCDSGETPVLQMSDETNAHAATVNPIISTYKKLCCDSSKLALINLNNKIYLSAQSNAHVSNRSIASSYPIDIPIGSATGTANCGTYSTSCPSQYTSLFSMSGDTNAHIAKPFFYDLNYCCNVVGTSSTTVVSNYNNLPVRPILRNACQVEGSFFCDYNNNWKNLSSSIFSTTVGGSGISTVRISEISFNAPNMSQTGTIPSSCCPDGYCWNGTYCIDGRVNISASNIVNLTQVYANGTSKNITNYGIICSEGNWTLSERKYSPFHDYSGYCLLNSQCYYAEGIGPTSNAWCYNDTQIVNRTSNGELLDFYCSNGNWTTRTKLLADTLLKIGEAETNKPFSIFCDDIKLQTSINELNYVVSGNAITLEAYAARYKEASGSNDKKSVCVLSIDGNNNGIFGDVDDKVVIGMPLKKEWASDTEFFVDISLCDTQFTNNEYQSCRSGGNAITFNNKNMWVYYNNFTKSVMFSEKSFIIPSTAQPNIFTRILNWIRAFLGLSPQFPISASALPKAFSYETGNFNHSNALTNHLYYYNNIQGKTIYGVKEYKSTTSLDVGTGDYRYYIYVNYTGFNLPLCKAQSVAGQYNTPRTVSGSIDKITCSADNTTIIMRLDPAPSNPSLNYWYDLTARTRPNNGQGGSGNLKWIFTRNGYIFGINCPSSPLTTNCNNAGDTCIEEISYGNMNLYTCTRI